VERVNSTVERAIQTLIAIAGQNSKDVVDVADHLKSMLTEFRKTLDYFQDEDAFNREYLQFMSQSSRCVVSHFDIEGWELPLYSVYFEVISHGGYMRKGL